ncbi:hypothetical protein [Ancylobacter terrae]|uniref:hypothetical protein n=1 Tax=Ancylobacter sp. sgz301288 TaxID=3342077 RepID=UPI00385E8CAF
MAVATFTAGQTEHTARDTRTAPRAAGSFWSRLFDRITEARMQQVRHMLIQQGYGAVLSPPAGREAAK